MRRGGEESSASTSARWLLLEAYASAYKAVKVYFRYPAWIVGDLLATPLWLLVFIYPVLMFLPYDKWRSPETYEFFYWGMVSWSVISTALWSIGGAIRSEQQVGTLEQLFLTNADRVVLFLGRLASSSIGLIIELAYMSLIVYLLFGVQVRILNPPLLAVALLLGLTASLGFGSVYGALVLHVKSPGAVANILQFALVILCGVFYPASRLPDFVEPLAYLVPFTYAIDLIRHAAMGTDTLLPAPLELAVLALYSVVLVALGYAALRRVELVSKRRGKLGFY